MNNGLWLISLKNISQKTKLPEKKIVHSFSYDNILLQHYNHPLKFLERTAKYYAVSSFDFSMDITMKLRHILAAVYDNRWSGAFMQAHGRLVIPTVGWLTPETYDLCFAGLKDGGVFLISTLGANNPHSYDIFMNGYTELRKRFPDTKIICVGDKLRGMDNDICYVLYEESFGNWDRYHNTWQPKLINWDLSIPEGVI